MRCALRQLASEYTEFIQKTDNKDVFNFTIRFLNFSKNLKDVLSISEGAPGINSIIEKYKFYMDQFKGQGKKHPVIVLLDTDEGQNHLTSIKNIVRNKYNVEMNKNKFSFVIHNLYIVLIPIDNSKIEDLFDKDILETKIDGKTFNPAKKINDKKEYSKTVFAKQVIVKKQNNINFSKFRGVFDSFKRVIADYKSRNKN